MSPQERSTILKMVSEGKITAEEGLQLLSAAEQPSAAEPLANTTAPVPTGKARWFRVRVTDTATGRAKATVNIPLALMNWGLSIGAQFAPEIRDMRLDELTHMLNEGFEGKFIDVIDEEDGEHVEIFIE